MTQPYVDLKKHQSLEYQRNTLASNTNMWSILFSQMVIFY